MKTKQSRKISVFTALLAMLALFICGIAPRQSLASGGSGGGSTAKVDTIKVSKCYYGFGQMLIKASSSDSTARLFAYAPSGYNLGEVQNGGGSRYGGTVMPYFPTDPVFVTIISSSGGSITVPTTPFQL
ncbi:MAG: hypothetical protein WCK55_09860 [Verrucomicrobiota bacterium]